MKFKIHRTIADLIMGPYIALGPALATPLLAVMEAVCK